MGNPYMKLLSLINPDEASANFHAIRGGVPKTNITYTGISGATAAASSGLSQDVTSSLELVGRYFPILLGIVALNALVLLILVIGGTVFYCRRRRTLAVSARTPRGRMSPMPMNVRYTSFPGNFQSPQQAHTYEPVSMALTEDTFVPSSPRAGVYPTKDFPASHDLDGNRDRLNFQSQQARTSEPVSMALTEDTFVPPSPAFHKLDGNRDSFRSNA